MFGNQPFSRLPSGTFAVSLSDDERRLIHDLPAELMKQLESGDDDGSIYRLFPPGYTDDLGRQVEYDRLMRDDLQSSHVAALRMLQDTSDATELGEEQLSTWMRGLNELRLVLGTRLDITEDLDETDFAPDDPRSGALALYLYLGNLQECVIDALGDPTDDISIPD